MKKIIGSAIVAGAIAVGSVLGTATANATANPAVCDGIDKASSYESYLLGSFAVGEAIGYPPKVQAQNIAESVMVYCPWHKKGLLAAIDNLTARQKLA